MTTERTDITADEYMVGLEEYLPWLEHAGVIDVGVSQIIYDNVEAAIQANPGTALRRIRVQFPGQQILMPLPYVDDIAARTSLLEFVAKVQQEPVSQPQPVVEAPPPIDTMTGVEYTEPSPEYAEVTGFERPPPPPATVATPSPFLQQIPPLATTYEDTTTIAEVGQPATKVYLTPSGEALQPPGTPGYDPAKVAMAEQQQAAAAEKEKYEGQTKDWWKIASATYLQWLVDANVISNDTMADLITTMNNKLSLLGTDTLSVAQASSNVPFVQEIVKGMSKHDFIVKESQAKAQRMAEQQQWARGQESRKLRAEERAAQRAAIQPQGVSGVPKVIRAAEKRQREQALARVPTTGDVYYPFLEEKLSPSMQGYYSGRLGEIMKEFEEAGGGRERKLWAEKESGVAADKRRGRLKSQLAATREFIKEEGERLRGPSLMDIRLGEMTAIAPTQRGGLEGVTPRVGSEGLLKAYKKEQALEDEMKAVKATPKEAGVDPFQKYLEQYPFLKKYMMLSPQQRGSYPSKYAPKARWVSY